MKRYITALGYYKGWYTWKTNQGSQVWKARRFGVRICHIELEGLLDMIDLKR